MAKDTSSSATIVGFPGTRKTLSSAAVEWAARERRISAATLAKFPVESATAFFPGLKRQHQCLKFLYRDEDWKARAFPEKDFRTNEGFAPTFWNLEAVLRRKDIDRLFIVEGELDALALGEVGIEPDQILAAPSATGNYDYVIEALKDGLNRAKKIIWCGDQDKPGLEMREAMARIFGPARFHFIDWPEGAKDANEFLKSDGPEKLIDLLKDGSVPWPTMGIFRLSEIPDSAPLTKWHPGFDWGEKMYLAPGTLSVTTGHPGMGKTMLWVQIWQQVVKTYGLVACIASFETRPKPHMRRQLRALHARQLEKTMSEADKAEADRWIDEHYLFLIHPERRPDLKWLLNEAETAVIRHGAKILQIDPWNRLEANREQRETETDYIGRCLREIYNFAVDLKCHVQILAHPSKVDSLRRGEPPELEDIAGSKHWDNMVDQGFVVHRPRLFDDEGNRETYAELHHKKARFDDLGYATKFGLDFDVDFGRYGTCTLKQKKKRKKENDDE